MSEAEAFQIDGELHIARPHHILHFELKRTKELANLLNGEIHTVLHTSVNLASNPSFCIILAYFLAANRLVSSDFAPVHTIFPDENISAVVLGSLIRMITAANRFGLYSALRALSAICFRSS